MRIIIFIFIYIQVITAQTFIKITEGPHVNDGGDSRAVNWIDFDNDQDLDLFVTNGPASGQNNFLYVNNGNGTFTKNTEAAITRDGAASDGSSWGDYNNDGYTDLVVVNWYNQNNLLYRNNGDNTFTNITDSPIFLDRGYSETASWGDFDKDGYLDLYVCNSEGTKRNFLYHNNRNGTFTKVISGPQSTDAFYSRNVDWVDYNTDGYPDIFVTNENGGNENLYQNNGDGTFISVSVPGLLSAGGNSTSSNWEDIDNDGDWDVFIANYGNARNFLFINNEGTFNMVTTGAVVTDTANSFGSTFGDIDNDGDLDLFVTNAFTGSTKTVNYLYLNDGSGNFTRDGNFSLSDSGWSYGCALGDYDKDGYLDLFVANCFNGTQNNTLYKNTGGSNNWIKLNLKGKRSNFSSIGAVVKVKAQLSNSNVWQTRKVAGQNGYCGQTLQLHFGVKNAAVIDSIQIIWPSGIIQFLTNTAVNQELIIEEDTTLISSAEESSFEPGESFLYQNYPNPFNPKTIIRYDLKNNNAALTSLAIYDVLGKKVSEFINKEQAAGEYEVEFDGRKFASGVYYYVLKSGDYIQSRKMVIIK